MNLEQYFASAWNAYRELTPSAARVWQLLEQRGEELLNDHIALRTFNHPQCNKEMMAAPFLQEGYRVAGHYRFEQKKLAAIHLEHTERTELPKIFISELLVEQCHPGIAMVFEECEEFLPAQLSLQTLAHIKRPWPAQTEEYHELIRRSEYAGWLYALGFRPNHFTLNVNALRTFDGLASLNTFLRQEGLVLNVQGGEIKGSPELYLEQSSTMADQLAVAFSDGEELIPTCYVEFARRYRDHEGRLFQGFLEQSADRIFESTHRSEQL